MAAEAVSPFKPLTVRAREAYGGTSEFPSGAQKRRCRVYFGGGGLFIVLGIIALVLGYTLIGIILIVLGLFAGGLGVFCSRRRGPPRAPPLPAAAHSEAPAALNAGPEAAH